MDIKIQTHFTPNKKNVMVNPQADILSIKTVGSYGDMYVNGLLLNGVRLSGIVLNQKTTFFQNFLFLQTQAIKNALEKRERIEIINDTQYELDTYTRALPGFRPGSGILDFPTDIITIQTSIKIQK